jgi:hypothetical protein
MVRKKHGNTIYRRGLSKFDTPSRSMKADIKYVFVLTREEHSDCLHYSSIPATPTSPIREEKLEAAKEAPTKSIHGGWAAQIWL